MNIRLKQRDVFIRRFKQARQRLGMSQAAVGIAAAIDPSGASARVNRYEKGVYEPDMETAARIAEVLNVPLPYLFALDENLAELILNFAQLPFSTQLELVEVSRKMIKTSPSKDSTEQFD